MEERTIRINVKVYARLIRVIPKELRDLGESVHVLLTEGIDDEISVRYTLKVKHTHIMLIRHENHNGTKFIRTKYHLWPLIYLSEFNKIRKHLRIIENYGHCGEKSKHQWPSDWYVPITLKMYEKMIELLNQVYDVPITKGAI
tara:strand:- start:4646 stop:5074 length:429 start_codon:yes stop_codon:yes gene_type:complete